MYVDLTIDDDGSGTIRIVTHGALDVASVGRVDEAIQDCAGADEQILLDLCEVDFMDSSGLALCMRTYRTLGDRFSLAPGDAASRLLDLTGLVRVLPIVDC